MLYLPKTKKNLIACTPPFRLRGRIYVLLPIFKQCCENCVAYRVKITGEDARLPALSIHTIFVKYFSVIAVENDIQCTNSPRSGVVKIWLYHQNGILLKFSNWRYTWEMVLQMYRKQFRIVKCYMTGFLLTWQWITTTYHAVWRGLYMICTILILTLCPLSTKKPFHARERTVHGKLFNYHISKVFMNECEPLWIPWLEIAVFVMLWNWQKYMYSFVKK